MICLKKILKVSGNDAHCESVLENLQESDSLHSVPGIGASSNPANFLHNTAADLQTSNESLTITEDSMDTQENQTLDLQKTSAVPIKERRNTERFAKIESSPSSSKIFLRRKTTLDPSIKIQPTNLPRYKTFARSPIKTRRTTMKELRRVATVPQMNDESSEKSAEKPKRTEKRGRGRPRKVSVVPSSNMPKRKRGRPKKEVTTS
jgi:hypothetical protein